MMESFFHFHPWSMSRYLLLFGNNDGWTPSVDWDSSMEVQCQRQVKPFFSHVEAMCHNFIDFELKLFIAGNTYCVKFCDGIQWQEVAKTHKIIGQPKGYIPGNNKKVSKLAKSIGKVKWFDNAKGYGFILNAENEDVFVHYRAIMGDGYKSLNEGEEVEFLQTRSEKGWQAAEVERTATNSVGQDESAVEYENELDAV